MPYSLDYNERIALDMALRLVLSEWDWTLPSEIVVEDIFAKDNSLIVVSQAFEHYSNEDLYNLIWQLQETIYEAMCASDFTQGIRSQFSAMGAVHNAMRGAING